MRIGFSLLILFFFGSYSLMAQQEQLALVKYDGGGDWYANPTALPNLASFCNQELNSNLDEDYATVELKSIEIFNYPFLHLTGHGNVQFSTEEQENLRLYLRAGGFLHVDDNYGMDEYIRPILENLFAEYPLQLLSISHPVFQEPYPFPEGLPKIHEHEGAAPEAWGIFIEGRLALLYTFEADLGDGWEDAEVHKDPEDIRLKALQMGANIIHHTFKKAL